MYMHFVNWNAKCKHSILENVLKKKTSPFLTNIRQGNSVTCQVYKI